MVRKKSNASASECAFIESLPEGCRYNVAKKIPVEFVYNPANGSFFTARIADPRLFVQEGKGEYWLEAKAQSKVAALRSLEEGIADILDIFCGVRPHPEVRVYYKVLLEYVRKK